MASATKRISRLPRPRSRSLAILTTRTMLRQDSAASIRRPASELSRRACDRTPNEPSQPIRPRTGTDMGGHAAMPLAQRGELPRTKLDVRSLRYDSWCRGLHRLDAMQLLVTDTPAKRTNILGRPQGAMCHSCRSSQGRSTAHHSIVHSRSRGLRRHMSSPNEVAAPDIPRAHHPKPDSASSLSSRLLRHNTNRHTRLRHSRRTAMAACMSSLPSRCS